MSPRPFKKNEKHVNFFFKFQFMKFQFWTKCYKKLFTGLLFKRSSFVDETLNGGSPNQYPILGSSPFFDLSVGLLFQNDEKYSDITRTITFAWHCPCIRTHYGQDSEILRLLL